MSNATTTAGTTATLNGKALKKRYGVRKAPLRVSSDVRVFTKVMPFDEEHAGKIDTASWIVLVPGLKTTGKDGQEINGTMIRANTYDGNLGDRADLTNENYIRDIPVEGSKDWKDSITKKHYVEITDRSKFPLFLEVEEGKIEEPTEETDTDESAA